MVEKVEANEALIIVDVQRDFCPNGALPVNDGDRVVLVVNRLIEGVFKGKSNQVFVTRDWHPAITSHFKEYGGQWPAHCVQNTPGAEFHPDLRLPEGVTIISKGMDPNKDAYSAFDGVTDQGVPLVDELRSRGIEVLYVGGLATDYCVRYTVLDALKNDFEVKLIQDGCRAVNPVAGEQDIGEMVEEGAELV